MAINGLWGIVLAAFGVCVFAVTLAFLVSPIVSSEAFLQGVTTIPPCGAGTKLFPNRLFTGVRIRTILGSSLSSGAAKRRLRIRQEAPEDGVADAPLRHRSASFRDLPSSIFLR